MSSICLLEPEDLRSRHPEDAKVSRPGSMLVVPKGDPTASLNLRVSPDLKQAVVDYARRVGIPINSAACVLLSEGLRSEAARP